MHTPVSNDNKLVGLSRRTLVESYHYSVLSMVSYLGLLDVCFRSPGNIAPNITMLVPLHVSFLPRQKTAMQLHWTPASMSSGTS